MKAPPFLNGGVVDLRDVTQNNPFARFKKQRYCTVPLSIELEDSTLDVMAVSKRTKFACIYAEKVSAYAKKLLP